MSEPTPATEPSAPQTAGEGATSPWAWLLCGLMVIAVGAMLTFGEETASVVVGQVILALGGLVLSVGTIGAGVSMGIRHAWALRESVERARGAAED